MNILEQWQLDREQQCAMLGISERPWYDRKRQAPARVGRDTLERVSYILGIWKALRLLLPDQSAYQRWPHLPNRAPLFGGRPPVERMTAGQAGDLYAVRCAGTKNSQPHWKSTTNASRPSSRKHGQ